MKHIKTFENLDISTYTEDEIMTMIVRNVTERTFEDGMMGTVDWGVDMEECPFTDELALFYQLDNIEYIYEDIDVPDITEERYYNAYDKLLKMSYNKILNFFKRDPSLKRFTDAYGVDVINDFKRYETEKSSKKYNL